MMGGYMRKKTKKTKKKNSKQFNQQFKKRFFTKKAGIIWIFTFIILFGMGIGCLKIERRVAKYEHKISELSTEIKDLQRVNEELEQQMNNVDSDEYIEKIARERLGMVKKGEYILRETEEDLNKDSEKKTKKKQDRENSGNSDNTSDTNQQ